MINAAVIVPVYRCNGILRLVLIRRSTGGVHGGQLAFPGGKCEPGESKRDAAVREVEEEIGLAADQLEIVEALPEVETRSSGFIISPFLARINPPDRWRIDQREVAEVVEVAVADMVKNEFKGSEVYPCFRVGSERLWGASYRIISPLVSRLLAGHWQI